MDQTRDRRIRRTRRQIRRALAQLMQQKSASEVTVKELVDLADINRSTFYLHYNDIFDLLAAVEQELFDEIHAAVHIHPVSSFEQEGLAFIEEVFSILYDNQEICAALVGPHGDMAFLHRIERMMEENVLQKLREDFPERRSSIDYGFAFCTTGAVGLIKHWLAGGCAEPPREMTQLTYRMIHNMMTHGLARPVSED